MSDIDQHTEFLSQTGRKQKTQPWCWLAELNIKEMEITKEIKKKGEQKTKK
jgi:AMMECR1 domain-containing protein